MADEQQAATPETGAGERDSNRDLVSFKGKGATDYYDSLDSLFEPAEPAPQTESEADDEGTPEADPPSQQAEPEPEAEAEGDDDADVSEGEADSEPEADEGDFPSELTLEDLAEAWGVDVDTLAKSVKVGDETLHELRRGTLREADYTRKTQELADQRKAFEAEREQQAKQLQDKTQQAESLVAFLAQEVDGGYSDAQLSEVYLNPASEHYNPDEFHRQKAWRDERRSRLHEATAHLHAVRQQQTEAQQQAIAEHRQAEIKRMVDLFAIKTPEDFQKLETNIAGYLTGEGGFSAEEVKRYFGGAFDARYVQLVDKARKYDEMQKAGKTTKKKLAAKPKPVKPGQARSKAEAKGEKVRKLRQRLANPNTGRSSRKAAALDFIGEKFGL